MASPYSKWDGAEGTLPLPCSADRIPLASCGAPCSAGSTADGASLLMSSAAGVRSASRAHLAASSCTVAACVAALSGPSAGPDAEEAAPPASSGPSNGPCSASDPLPWSLACTLIGAASSRVLSTSVTCDSCRRMHCLSVSSPGVPLWMAAFRVCDVSTVVLLPTPPSAFFELRGLVEV